MFYKCLLNQSEQENKLTYAKNVKLIYICLEYIEIMKYHDFLYTCLYLLFYSLHVLSLLF